MAKVTRKRGALRLKRAQVEPESLKKRKQRLLLQIASHLQALALLLHDKGAMPKLPMLQASDVLCLTLFCRTLLKMPLALDIVAIFFLAAHHIRDPKLLKNLMEKVQTVCPSRGSEAVRRLDDWLAGTPFKHQLDGLPYHIGNCKWCTGVPAVRKWLEPSCELDFVRLRLGIAQLRLGRM